MLRIAERNRVWSRVSLVAAHTRPTCAALVLDHLVVRILQLRAEVELLLHDPCIEEGEPPLNAVCACYVLVLRKVRSLRGRPQQNTESRQSIDAKSSMHVRVA